MSALPKLEPVALRVDPTRVDPSRVEPPEGAAAQGEAARDDVRRVNRPDLTRGEQRVNLLGLTRDELEAFMEQRGEKKFRARQLLKWMYKRGVSDFDQMTDLAKSFRETLRQGAEITTPEVIRRQVSKDGTRKWVLNVGGGAAAGRAETDQYIEMVYIPEPGRGTLCISSQVGCAMDCSFCSTAQQGFNRNLTAAEIVGQVWLANQELMAARAPLIEETEAATVGNASRLITNVVFMGMGEPLANYRNIVPAASVLMDDFGFDMSRRRVTVSTSGLVPQMRKLAEETNCALAVSLHAPTDELRDQLVPINRRHPIAELLDACWHYVEKQNARSVTFEYVMLDGINDHVAQARALAKLLQGRPAKLNLIPFNSFPGTDYRCSTPEAIERFRSLLNAAGVIATTRRTRGDDIDAACGQLVGRVRDRTTVRLGSKVIGVTVQ